MSDSPDRSVRSWLHQTTGMDVVVLIAHLVWYFLVTLLIALYVLRPDLFPPS